MKRIVLIFFVLLFFSTLALAETICSKDKDCNDKIGYTKDVCLGGVCSNEISISNSQNALLKLILEKLIELVNKDWIVNVEAPQVIVEPNITVMPNITIPSKECKWEIYSQIMELNLEGDGSSVFISIPQGYLADKVNVTDGYVLFKWTSGGSDRSIVKVNGVECLSKTGNSGYQYFMQSLNSACFSAFDVGLNNINIDNLESSRNEIGIKTMWLEMKVKPANC